MARQIINLLRRGTGEGYCASWVWTGTPKLAEMARMLARHSRGYPLCG